MEITRTLNTTSSKKYLEKRTVCVPMEFYNSVDRYDKVVINISSGYNQMITINSSYTDLRQRCELKEAYGDTFYILPY